MTAFQRLAMLLALACAGSAQAQLRRGDVPPDFLGLDTDKKEIRVSDHRGKVVVLTFWASWCGYCLQEIPVLENVQRQAGKERMQVVAINTDKDYSKYRAMRRKMRDFQLTMTRDVDGAGIADKYGVTGLPHLVMVDKEGLVAYVHRGYSDAFLNQLVDEINGLIEETVDLPAASGN